MTELSPNSFQLKLDPAGEGDTSYVVYAEGVYLGRIVASGDGSDWVACLPFNKEYRSTALDAAKFLLDVYNAQQ